MITSLGYWGVALLGVVLHWSLPVRLRAACLALLSIGYLSFLDPLGCAAFLAWSLAFYWLAPHTRRGGRRGLLPALILSMLGYLALFKYAPPLVEAVLGYSASSWLAAPIGLSYFTFKLIHYAVEVSRRNIRERSLASFLSYVFLFPIFTAGPIERYDHFLANAEQQLTRASLVEGLTRIVHGLVKKFVLVEIVLEQLVASGKGPDLTTGLGVWKLCITSLLSVYLDFSAYSDIAIGTSRLFGLRIMENFNWPLFAPNLGEFWKRWHMTLVGWCRSYVYLPTIGLTRRPNLAVYALCLSVGLWHAGSLNYMLWGLYHATGVVIFQKWKRLRTRLRWTALERWPWSIPGVALTFLFVSSSFVFTGPSSLPRLPMLARLLFIDID